MANVDQLMKLNRDQLNEFAGRNGITDAEKFEDKRSLAEAVSPNVTDEQLGDYVQSQKDGDDGSDEDDSSQDDGQNEDGANDADAVGVGDDPYSVAAGGAPQSEDDNGEDAEAPSAEAPYDKNDPNNTKNGRVDTAASGTPGAPQNEDMEHMDGIAHPR